MLAKGLSQARAKGKVRARASPLLACIRCSDDQKPDSDLASDDSASGSVHSSHTNSESSQAPEDDQVIVMDEKAAHSILRRGASSASSLGNLHARVLDTAELNDLGSHHASASSSASPLVAFDGHALAEVGVAVSDGPAGPADEEARVWQFESDSNKFILNRDHELLNNRLLGKLIPWGASSSATALSTAVRCQIKGHKKCTRSLSELAYTGVTDKLGEWLVAGLTCKSENAHRGLPRPPRDGRN